MNFEVHLFHFFSDFWSKMWMKHNIFFECLFSNCEKIIMNFDFKFDRDRITQLNKRKHINLIDVEMSMSENICLWLSNDRFKIPKILNNVGKIFWCKISSIDVDLLCHSYVCISNDAVSRPRTNCFAWNRINYKDCKHQIHTATFTAPRFHLSSFY